jgi:hypothetical protein
MNSQNTYFDQVWKDIAKSGILAIDSRPAPPLCLVVFLGNELFGLSF